MHSIRKFVGYGAAALGLGAISVLSLAQVGQAAAPHAQIARPGVQLQAATPSPQCTAALDALKAAKTQDAGEDTTERAVAKTNPDAAADTAEDKAEAAALTKLRDTALSACVQPATPQCTAAMNALKAARTQDLAEDTSERALAKTAAGEAADVNEDTAEKAALKPLVQALATNCGFGQLEAARTQAAPSAQCTTAKAALKAAFDRMKADRASEASTEGTSADQAEDKAEAAQIMSLMKAAAAACGFGHPHSDFEKGQTESFSFSR